MLRKIGDNLGPADILDCSDFAFLALSDTLDEDEWLEASFPYNRTVYIDFGYQQQLLIDPELNVAFEGVYVTPHFHLKKRFTLHLVCDDPHFGSGIFPNFDSSLWRMGNAVQVPVGRGWSVDNCLDDIEKWQINWADPALLKNHDAIRTAVELTAKAIVLISTHAPYVTVGRYGTRVESRGPDLSSLLSDEELKKLGSALASRSRF